MVFDLLRELDSAFPKSPYRLIDIVAIKRNISSARRRVIAIGWVHAYIRFGCIGDQPTVSDICSRTLRDRAVYSGSDERIKDQKPISDKWKSLSSSG